MLLRRHSRKWVRYGSIIIQSKKKTNKKKNIILYSVSFNKQKHFKSRTFLWHSYFFAVLKTSNRNIAV